MNQIHDIANKLLWELKRVSIKAYIWHKATTGSCYIRFKDNRIGSIRIGDHPGREHLKYKFNIRTDNVQEGWQKDETWRYYIKACNWKKIIPVIQNQADKVQNYKSSKYSYTIPKFKQ